MDSAQPWGHIYATKRSSEVSWYQSDPDTSISLIQRVAPDAHSVIADVGGGASTLVDGLLNAGYRNLTVLDISEVALAESRRRLGERASQVVWVHGDVLQAHLPSDGIDLWCDRALFHFFTNANDRSAYAGQVRRALRTGGHLLVATFAEDGPRRCSGLDVARYSASTLRSEFGEDFELVRDEHEDHITPAGVHQAFLYCLFRYTHRPSGEPVR